MDVNAPGVSPEPATGLPASGLPAADLPAGTEPAALRLLRDGGLPLAAVLVAALVLRLLGLDDGLWLDEILTLADFARRPPLEVLGVYPNDNHHPLYSFAAALCVAVAGESAAALRAPAVAFGVASVAALYVLARRLLSRGPSLAAAAILALFGRHVFFSQNARGYTALLFFALVAASSFLRARDARRGAAGSLALALALGAYSHLTGVFVGVGQAVVQLLRPGPGGRFAAAPWRGILGGGAVTLLLHAPMAADLWRFFVARPDRVAVRSSWTDPLHFLREAAAAAGPKATALAAAAAVLGGVVVLAGIVALERRRPGAALAMLMPPLLGGGATVALGRHLWPRFFFFAAGYGVIWCVAGVVSSARTRAPASRRRLVAGVLGAAVLASAATTRGAYGPKQDFLGPLRLLAPQEAAAFATPGVFPSPRPSRAPGPQDPRVFTTGLALWPYAYLFAPGWTPVALGPSDLPVDDPTALATALGGPERDRVRVVACSPVFLASRQPRTAELLERECREIARFGGTMGAELDLVVYAPR
jgi:hypothetical protein